MRFREVFAVAWVFTIPIVLGSISWSLRNSPSVAVRTGAAVLAVIAVGFAVAAVLAFHFTIHNPDAFEVG